MPTGEGEAPLATFVRVAIISWCGCRAVRVSKRMNIRQSMYRVLTRGCLSAPTARYSASVMTDDFHFLLLTKQGTVNGGVSGKVLIATDSLGYSQLPAPVQPWRQPIRSDWHRLILRGDTAHVTEHTELLRQFLARNLLRKRKRYLAGAPRRILKIFPRKKREEKLIFY